MRFGSRASRPTMRYEVPLGVGVIAPLCTATRRFRTYTRPTSETKEKF
jgi:hypothetical protein